VTVQVDVLRVLYAFKLVYLVSRAGVSCSA